MTITVIVDDNDPAITYSGSWALLQTSITSSSSSIKQTIGETLHGAPGGPEAIGSDMLYNFSGSSISIFALMTPDFVNVEKVPYNWGCAVDEISAGPLSLQKLTEPTTIKICEFTNLTDGPHQLIFQFLGASTPEGTVIYFDYIEYLPTRSATPQTFSLIGISFDDEAFTYDHTWITTTLDDGTMGMITNEFPESTVQVKFNGSSVTWIGFLLLGLGANNETATYSIDGQPDVQFTLPQYTSNNKSMPADTQPGQVFFETTQLDATTPHNMHLRYSSSALLGQQLSVQSIIIGNGTVPALTANATDVPAAKRQHALTRDRPIIAGVLAGVFATAILIIALRLVHRRRGRGRTQNPLVVQAFSSQPSPLLARLTTIPSVTTIDIKGRRRLPPVPVPPGVIPPSKLTARSTDTSTQAPDEQDQVQPATENTQAEEAIDNIRDPPARATRTRVIQEEDSGLRLVERGADGEEEIIRVLPPVYTAI